MVKVWAAIKLPFLHFVLKLGSDILHMNRFCVALEVITTCESSATHVTGMVRISSMCDNVPFKVPLCMAMFITLNTLILW